MSSPIASFVAKGMAGRLSRLPSSRHGQEIAITSYFKAAAKTLLSMVHREHRILSETRVSRGPRGRRRMRNDQCRHEQDARAWTARSGGPPRRTALFSFSDKSLGEGVVVDVWAAAIPIPPASIAAAISPILVIRMRRTLLVADESRRPLAVTYANRSRRTPVPHQSRDKKGPPLPGGAQ